MTLLFLSRLAADKRNEVENKLHGCNSAQSIIPMFAMEKAAAIFDPCPISVVLDTDDYIQPQMACLKAFVNTVSEGLWLNIYTQYFFVY